MQAVATTYNLFLLPLFSRNLLRLSGVRQRRPASRQQPQLCREQHSIRGATKSQLIDLMKGEGGFVYGGFCSSAECEAAIKAETGATIRVLPDPEFRSPVAPTTCIWCGKPSVAEAVWAQAY